MMFHALILAASLDVAPLTVKGCLQWQPTPTGNLCLRLDPNYVDPVIYAECVDALHREQAAAHKRGLLAILLSILTLDPIGAVYNIGATAQHGQDLRAAANCH